MILNCFQVVFVVVLDVGVLVNGMYFFLYFDLVLVCIVFIKSYVEEFFSVVMNNDQGWGVSKYGCLNEVIGWFMVLVACCLSVLFDVLFVILVLGKKECLLSCFWFYKKGAFYVQFVLFQKVRKFVIYQRNNLI